MPRVARVVIPGFPHHIIQRGNRRQKVFFQDEDKAFYLKLLKFHSRKEGIAIWVYCLMDNHVHFIAVPEREDSLARGIGELHRKYTNIINIRHNWKGFLWQGRFISYPLDDRYVYTAVRYIEQNPIKAGLVQKPEDYSWSSARSHVFKEEDDLLSDFPLLSEIPDWSSYLREPVTEEDRRLLLQHEKCGRPLGSKDFLRKIERITGRPVIKRKPGRPRKKAGEKNRK
ncbi:transposase [bacterium]|nr:transposase [bacterium]